MARQPRLAAGATDATRARRLLKEGLRRGHLDLALAGEKRHGEFHLIRTHSSKSNTWLLVKAMGEGASRKVAPPGAPAPSFQITHPGKVFWPAEGFTKRDLARYYEAAAAFVLPSLRDRPESMHRFPDGIGKPGFYQKNLQRHPDWIRTVRLRAETVDREINYLVCDDLDTLLYMVNLGSVDLNPWHSRVASLDQPDYLLLDLDAKTADFSAVLRVAVEARRLLEEFRLESYPKTSGKMGLHICLPLGARYSYDQTRALAEGLMRALNARLPNLTSVELIPERRQGRVYLDFLQNHKGKTMAAPYSVRPVPGAPVSTPLDWSEVTPDLTPSAFTLNTAPRRFREVGDLWAPVHGPAIDLPTALEDLRDAGHGKAPG